MRAALASSSTITTRDRQPRPSFGGSAVGYFQSGVPLLVVFDEIQVRPGLASALNNLLPSPTLEAWRTGETCDTAVLDGSDAQAIRESAQPPSLEPASGGLIRRVFRLI